MGSLSFFSFWMQRIISKKIDKIYIVCYSIYEKTEVEMEKRKRRLVNNIVFYSVLTIVVLAVYVIVGSSNSVVAPFGYSTYAVLSGSMEPDIRIGSLVIVKKVDAENIEVGNDITFVNSERKTVTHRVVEIHEDYMGSGVRGFVTKGIRNPMPDKDIVYADNIRGVVRGNIQHIGRVGSYIKEHPFYIVFAGILLIALGYVLRYLNKTKRPKMNS